jgi:DinB family protein
MARGAGDLAGRKVSPRVMEEPLSPELAGYQKQFTANRREAAALCSGLSPAQFNWRPEPHRWSIAECLLHLNVGADVYTRLIEIATERGRARGVMATGPFRYGFLSRWLLGSLEPPVRRRYKTPRQFYPAPGVQHTVADVLIGFESAGRRWDECLRRANGLDLARVKVPSPVLPLLRFQLGPLFAGQAAHERRHLWQGEQVRAATDFPET